MTTGCARDRSAVDEVDEVADEGEQGGGLVEKSKNRHSERERESDKVGREER